MGRHSFKHWSIRNKLNFIIVSVSLLVAILVTSTLVYFQIRQSREALTEELQTMAEMIGNNSAAAVLFGDRTAAREILSALRARPAVTSANLFKPNGEIFAHFNNQTTWNNIANVPPLPGMMINDRLAVVTSAIRNDGEIIGYIEISHSLVPLHDVVNRFLIIAAAITLAAMFVAVPLAGLLQRLISSPLASLVATMQRVSAERDYGIRAVKTSFDETGVLIDGFNRMLERTQSQHAELEQYRRNLEATVQERTRDLTQANTKLTDTIADLERAKTEAEAASRAKSEFLANMSHELRTPLNAIMGFSDVIRREMLGPLGTMKYREYASDIYSGGDHLLEIINDILDVSRIEVGKFKLDKSVVDIVPLLERSIRLVRADADGKQVRIRLESFPTEGIFLDCDPGRIRQILLNILSNSIKFNVTGGSITISIFVRDLLTIVISDTGIGIAEADIPKVLQPFGQVESAFSRHYQGTGLGLSLSKTLTEMHGGNLELESLVGAGTTVTLTFPVLDARQIAMLAEDESFEADDLPVATIAAHPARSAG